MQEDPCVVECESMLLSKRMTNIKPHTELVQSPLQLRNLLHLNLHVSLSSHANALL
jgi:hypothetical protein